MSGRTLLLVVLAGVLVVGPGHAAEVQTNGYARLLEAHLAIMHVDRQPGVTAFDYVGLHRHPDADAGLRAIREQLLALPPSRMTAKERTAWAINLYNFLVIERVMAHFGADGHPPASVRDIPGFFSGVAATVEGRTYSLDALERHFLFADFDRAKGGPRPAALDPRIHFAIVCAARGCPPLQGKPYRAATLDADLDAAARRALLSPAHLRADPRTLTYAISSIFDWYVRDFGGRAGVIEFLEHNAFENEAGQIGDRGEKALRGFIPWDWKLNQVAEEFHRAR